MSIITLVDLTTDNDSYSAGGLTTLLPVYHSDVDDDDVVNAASSKLFVCFFVIKEFLPHTIVGIPAACEN